MIDGRKWHEIDFLYNAYKQIFDDALVDEEFKTTTFEKGFASKARRLINQWTMVEFERESLLRDMLDSALDDRRLL